MTRSMAFTLALLAAGCASQQSLYDELGGKEGLDRISAHFIAGIPERPEVREHFEHTNLDRFYRLFSEHLCHVAGGPCEYTGDDMIETHEGMRITEAEFNEVVDLLISAMNREGIPQPVQNRLLHRLAPLRSEIIYF